MYLCSMKWAIRLITVLLIALIGFTGKGIAKSDSCESPRARRHHLLTCSNCHKRANICIGFSRGYNFLDVAHNGYVSKISKIDAIGAYITIPFEAHFKLETGLKYSSITNITPPTGNLVHNGKVGKINQPTAGSNTLTMPVTLQYYFNTGAGNRIQSYFGLGTLFTFNRQATGLLQTEGKPNISTSGSEFINLMFTQGIIIEVNTKIQLKESIHVISYDGQYNYGVDFGIGVKMK